MTASLIDRLWAIGGGEAQELSLDEVRARLEDITRAGMEYLKSLTLSEADRELVNFFTESFLNLIAGQVWDHLQLISASLRAFTALSDRLDFIEARCDRLDLKSGSALN